jgi:hypothetical protein
MGAAKCKWDRSTATHHIAVVRNAATKTLKKSTLSIIASESVLRFASSAVISIHPFSF